MSYLQQKNNSTLLRLSPNCHDENPNSGNNFRVNLPGHLAQFRNVTGVQVVNVTMPNAFYNIDEHNCYFSVQVYRREYSVSGTLENSHAVVTTPRHFYLRHGYYSVDDILAIFSQSSGTPTQIIDNNPRTGNYPTTLPSEAPSSNYPVDEAGAQLTEEDGTPIFYNYDNTKVNPGNGNPVLPTTFIDNITFDQYNRKFTIFGCSGTTGFLMKNFGDPDNTDHNSFNQNGTYYLDVSPEDYTSTPPTRRFEYFYRFSGPLFEVLGFGAAEAEPFFIEPYDPEGTPNTDMRYPDHLMASNMTNLEAPQEVYIHSPQLTSGVIDVDPLGGKVADILAVVPMTGPFGSLIQWEPRDMIKEYVGGYRCLNDVEISLRDCNGRLLPFYAHQWHLTLRVFYTYSI